MDVQAAQAAARRTPAAAPTDRPPTLGARALDPQLRLQHARDAAWRALSRRERTETELVQQGYVDDAAYARRFAEDRRRLDAWGARRIEQRLVAAGVAAEHVAAAIAGLHSGLDRGVHPGLDPVVDCGRPGGLDGGAPGCSDDGFGERLDGGAPGCSDDGFDERLDGDVPGCSDDGFDERLDGELAAALALLRRRMPRPPETPRERDRALGLLLRKGYEPELAYDAVRRHAGADEAF